MDKFIIQGGNPLKGEISISGAKNAVLPIMAATVIAPGEYRINNVPHLRDTITMARLLEMTGAHVEFKNHCLLIDTHSCNKPIAPYELVKTMRASFYMLGPFLSRFNHAEVSLPGGCAWGPRPVDFHLQAMEKLGADISLTKGMIIAEGKLRGNEINFPKSSVGATGNAMMAAVSAHGRTIIKNAAMEPDIVSLAEFLNKMGAEISGHGTSNIIINGGEKLEGNFEYTVIPDRIEAGTFLIAGSIIKSNITLTHVNPGHFNILLSNLKAAGTLLNITNNSINVKSPTNGIQPIDVNTEIYPGFPTDLQAQWIALMTLANGESLVTDDIYVDRFTHIAELSRFGAEIQLSKNQAKITGVRKLKGAPVMSTDIRASASLILAALAAEGESHISRIYHIDRGYENIEEKLKSIGALIDRKKE